MKIVGAFVDLTLMTGLTVVGALADLPKPKTDLKAMFVLTQ